jgi:tetratricopeptide (TPR) repeat protein
MDALVSGQAGVAILVQGNEALFVSMDELDAERKCSLDSIPYLLNCANDVIELRAVSKEVALSQLRQAWKFDRALHLILILLDVDEEEETRALAAESIPDLITDQRVRERLENHLYSATIPNVKGLEDAPSFFLGDVAFPALLKELAENQKTIGIIQRGWDDLPESLFENPDERGEFHIAAVHSGAFRLLAKSIGNPSDLSLAILECYTSLKGLPNHRSILGSWFAPLKPERIRRDGSNAKQIDDDLDLEKSNRERYPTRTPSPFETFENVKKQKQAIISQLGKGDFNKVRKFVDELIQFQLKSGKPKYATMSLCDLAQHAKNVCNYSLQLEFAKRAVDLSSEDGWAHGQVADAYLCLGRYNDALQSLNQAALYGELAYAKSGEARILWGQGHLEAALVSYNKVISEYPDESYSWNGRSEVLRQMWRYEEALDSYENATKRFPSDSIAWCGKAATLKDLGRLVDALRAYSDAIGRFPDVAVPRDGYADVLKDMGQLGQALDAYNENVSLSSEDSVARCGRAEVLRAMGRSDEALQAYTEAIEDFPFVPVPYCGRAETLRDMGRLEEALDYYQQIIGKFPSDPRAHNGRANIMKRLGRLSDSLQAYDEVVRKFPYDIIGLSGRADLLKELGKFRDALDAYDALIKRNPISLALRNAKASILVVLQRYDEAQRLLATGTPETREDWISYHIRGMILLKKDMLSPAIRHLKKGLELIPFADQRKYFQNALAIATLRQDQYYEATQYIGGSRESITDALRIHAFGGLKRLDQASQAYTRLLQVCPPNLVPLRNELAAKYKLTGSLPSHDGRWIFEQECQNVLLEAA